MDHSENKSGLSESVRNDSESFGKVSESVRKDAGRYSLSVKDVKNLLEQRGFPRTERSITGYCQRGHLDCVGDPDEKRHHETYRIAPESVGTLIEKLHKIKQKDSETPFPKDHEPFPKAFGNDSETIRKDSESNENLQQKILDLTILNNGKDYFIEQLKSERAGLFQKVEDTARMIGQLETKLLQLEAGKSLNNTHEAPKS